MNDIEIKNLDVEAVLAGQDENIPDDIASVAKQYFRRMCETRRTQLSNIRMDPDRRKAEILRHQQGAATVVDHLNRTENRWNGLTKGQTYDQFLADNNIKEDDFSDSLELYQTQIMRAHHQFHLSYCDHLTGEKYPEVRYEIFKDVCNLVFGSKVGNHPATHIDERRPAHRPGVLYDMMRTELIRMEKEDELPPVEGPWMTTITEILHAWAISEGVNGAYRELRKTPQMTSIRKRLSPEINALKDREKTRY
jgi:hypothetical protein